MLKKVLAAVAALLVLGVGALVTKLFVLSPKKRAPLEVKAPSTPEAIARGKYLAEHVMACVACHSTVNEGASGEPPVDGKIGIGRDFGDHPEMFPGHIRSRNLTPDPETGLGQWSDGEILRALREGVSRDGRPLFPMMPYLTYAKTMTVDDGLAIIAYLRALPPVKNAIAPMEVDFPISMFARAAPTPLEGEPAPPPDAAKDPLARGNWLITACSCADCHTTVNARREPLPGHYLAGGNPMPVPGKGTYYTANITADQATGIGAYSDEDLLRVINEGIGKSGRALYAMPWPYYKGMTDEDKKALVLALRQVPAIPNLVPPPKLN